MKKSYLVIAWVIIGQKRFSIVDRDNKIMGSNDRIRIGFRYIEEIGRISKMGENFFRSMEKIENCRKPIEYGFIDIVCIPTPAHWYALQTINAIQAGKDVYVEKLLSKTIVERKKIKEIGNKCKKIVSAGLNRRSVPIFQKLADEMHGGKVVKINFVQTCYVSDMFPNGIGKQKSENPPRNFNWNMWFGIASYMFRRWEDCATQISDNGVYCLDLICCLIDEYNHTVVSVHGGKFVIDDA